MSNPQISVAMSVYNNARYVAASIESILSQTIGNFEFLILNDGSTDASADIIESFAKRDRRIRVVHQANRGLIPSLNLLIQMARAPLIARMDGDDISLPHRFERQLAFLSSNSDHGVVGTSTYDIDEEGRLAEHNDDYPSDHEGVVKDLERWSPLCHSSVMMRTEIVRAVGGYREAYCHCEDYDLWLRLSLRTRLCSLTEQLHYYRRSPAQISSRHAMEQQTGAAIAWLAHRQRVEGHPDPTDGLPKLPTIDELDRVFGQQGVSREVRFSLAPKLVYSASALKGDGFRLLMEYLGGGGAATGQWRTVARLLTFGRPIRAAQLGAHLAAKTITGRIRLLRFGSRKLLGH